MPNKTKQVKRKSSGVRIDDNYDLEDPVNKRGAFSLKQARKELPPDFTKLTPKQLEKISQLADARLSKHKELIAYCKQVDKQRRDKEQTV